MNVECLLNLNFNFNSKKLCYNRILSILSKYLSIKYYKTILSFSFSRKRKDINCSSDFLYVF